MSATTPAKSLIPRHLAYKDTPERIEELLRLNRKYTLINKRASQRETVAVAFKNVMLDQIRKDLEKALEDAAKDPERLQTTWFPSSYSREIAYGSSIMPEDKSFAFTKAEKEEITRLAHIHTRDALSGLNLEESEQEGRKGIRIDVTEDEDDSYSSSEDE